VGSAYVCKVYAGIAGTEVDAKILSVRAVHCVASCDFAVVTFIQVMRYMLLTLSMATFSTLS
jgi:hypothetical protein